MAGDKLASGTDEVPGLPQGHEAQYAALMKLPANDVKKMLRDIKLPLAGSKSQQVVRLVRELASLPPVAEDKELFQAGSAKKGSKGKGKGRGRGRGRGKAAEGEGGEGESEPQVQAAEGAVGEQEMDAAMKEIQAEVKAAAAAAAPPAPTPKKAAAEARQEKRGRGQPEPESRKKSRVEEEEDVGAKQVSCSAPEPKETSGTTERGEPAAKAEEEEADEDDDDDEEEDPVMDREGQPGAITVTLLDGQADLLQAHEGKWLSCVKEVLEADVELSLPPKAKEVDKETGEAEDGPPKVLRVSCPNGQQECEGDYELVQGTLANGQPLWKSSGSSRWLYSGTDGTWLVGGTKQKAQEFACRTGYLHLRAPHKGKLPHLAQGIWRRVDGKSWCEDLAVVISKPLPDFRCPGLPVCVSGLRKRPLRRLNGALGRLLAREAKSWRVRLAEGSEESLPPQNLERRNLDPGVGEAWLRPRQEAVEHGHVCKVFDSLLRLAAEAEAPEGEGQVRKLPKLLASSCCQLRVPEVASESVTSTIAEAETNLQVACIWRYQEEDEADEDLAPGAPATAPYEGSRCPCTVKEVHGATKQATVTWDYDGSESQVPLKDLKPKLDKEGKARRQRRQWLRGAWTLVVLGGARQRRVAALQLLASVEDSCPGLWTTDLNDTVAELRRGLSASSEEATASSAVEVEARALRGPDAEPWLVKAAEAGKLRLSALRRAGHAADCSLELMLPAGLFIVGTKVDRPRALDYVRWLLAEGESEAAACRAERALRGDITVLRTVRGRSVWLERAVLKGIERETRTLIILEHGSGEAEVEGEEASTAALAGQEKSREDWDPEGPAEVHVCGSEPLLRARAVGQLEGLLQAMAVVEAESQEPVSTERPTKNRRLEEELQEERRRREELEKKFQDLQAQSAAASAPAAQPVTTAPAGAAAAAPSSAASGAPTAAEAPAAPAQARSTLPTDPVVEMRKLTYWPKDNQTWLSLQDIIWANHPKLSPNWIRVWSRSKDHEYYVRLTDGKSSLNFADAQA